MARLGICIRLDAAVGPRYWEAFKALVARQVLTPVQYCAFEVASFPFYSDMERLCEAAAAERVDLC